MQGGNCVCALDVCMPMLKCLGWAAKLYSKCLLQSLDSLSLEA